MKGRCNVNVKFSLLVIAYLEVRGSPLVPRFKYGPSHGTRPVCYRQRLSWRPPGFGPPSLMRLPAV